MSDLDMQIHLRWARNYRTTVCNKHMTEGLHAYSVDKPEVETLQLKSGYVWCTKCEDTAFNPIERLALVDLGDSEVPPAFLIPNIWLDDRD